MKKSEVIAAAIAKIEASRPALHDYICAQIDSGEACAFIESKFSKDYDIDYARWSDEYNSVVKHLNVALSVAIADEYLTQQ